MIDCGWGILQCEDNKLGFYLASREFEDWELKILTDAVLGANFLTENNSKEIADKIGLLASKTTAKALKAVTPVETDIKTGDISTKNNIDIIIRAIKDKKKLVFRYVFKVIVLDDGSVAETVTLTSDQITVTEMPLVIGQDGQPIYG